MPENKFHSLIVTMGHTTALSMIQWFDAFGKN